MTDGGAGVPSAAGVPGVESDAFSLFEAGAAGSVFEVAGDSLAGEGESSLMTGGAAVGSRIARSFSDDTVKVTRPGDWTDSSAVFSTLSDLRRSLEAAPVLLEGAMAACVV